MKNTMLLSLKLLFIPYSAAEAADAISADKLCAGVKYGSIVGTASCLATAEGIAASASQVLSGFWFWNSTGVSTVGTMRNNGTWTLSGLLSSFGGAGYVAGVTGLPAASSICVGTTIVGVAGTAICNNGTPTGSDPIVGEILTGKTLWSNSGSVLNGTMADRGTWNIMTSAFPGVGYVSQVTNALTPADVCSNRSLFGNSGTAVCLATSGGTNASATEVLTGTYFWNSSGTSTAGTMANRSTWDMQTAFPGSGYFAAISNAPSASVICSGVSVNGVAGTASCNKTFADLVPSNLHRNKGGTPTQLSLVGEKLAAGSFSAGYRIIPEVLKDDTGVDTNADGVERSGTVWNGTVPRKVCGMGIATLAARIADCDSRHSTKPGWDSASSDGKISWNGAIKGNQGESEWTLITVYDASKTNGDTCSATGCREVWRDDRTGQVWSDFLGDGTSNANQGKFNWCLATGNTQTGTISCASGAAGSYNSAGVSICAEGTGLTTPVGVHNATTSTDVTSWSSTGTTIRDAKGGMMNTTNTDPAGDAQSPSIKWRLPSRLDWQQAIINGALKVLARKQEAIWTSTTQSADRTVSYYLDDSEGYTNTNSKSSNYYVRCVGR